MITAVNASAPSGIDADPLGRLTESFQALLKTALMGHQGQPFELSQHPRHCRYCFHQKYSAVDAATGPAPWAMPKSSVGGNTTTAAVTPPKNISPQVFKIQVGNGKSPAIPASSRNHGLGVDESRPKLSRFRRRRRSFRLRVVLRRFCRDCLHALRPTDNNGAPVAAAGERFPAPAKPLKKRKRDP